MVNKKIDDFADKRYARLPGRASGDVLGRCKKHVTKKSAALLKSAVILIRSDASAAQNLKGSVSLENLTQPAEFSTTVIANFDGVIPDVRQKVEFGAGHIPNAINIGLGGKLATWAGTLLTTGTPRSQKGSETL